MSQEIPITNAAKLTNMSRRTIERMIAAGHLRSYKRPGDRRTYVDLEAVKETASRSLQRGLYLRCSCYLPVQHRLLRDKLMSALEAAQPASHPRDIEAVTTRGGGAPVEQSGIVWTVSYPLGSTLTAAAREVTADFRELASGVTEYRNASFPRLTVQISLFQA